MRIKSVLIFIVLNIFLMLMTSVMFEYINLEGRLNNITRTINEAANSSVMVATASEELFSAKFNTQNETSYGVTNTYCPIHSGSHTKVASNILLFDDQGEAHQVNTYALAYYFCSTDSNGILPKTSMDFNNLDVIDSKMTTETTYEFLFGGVGSDYADNSLDWSTLNSPTKKYYQDNATQFSGSRKMNTSSINACSTLPGTSKSLSSEGIKLNDFQSYVNNVYKNIYTKGILKEKAPTGSNKNYDIRVVSYPVLMNLGLQTNGALSFTMYNDAGGTISTETWNNIVASNPPKYTNDYVCGSVHVGKRRSFVSGAGLSSSGTWSRYYLTPNTLGVTYVPLSVAKSSFEGLLRTNIQLNKISGGGLDNFTTNYKETIKKSYGCVPTTVYDISAGVVANTPQTHTVAASEGIINDGDIEYDINSTKIKVEYFDCDFYSNSPNIDTVISRIEGSVSNWRNSDGAAYGRTLGSYSGLDDVLADTREKLTASDTRQSEVLMGSENNKGHRLVAKVTYRVKVHIPYKSPIMQWLCRKDGNSSHYDIRQFNGMNGNLDYSEDGLWYQYSTYYAVTR